VQHALPDLVGQILPETTPPFEQRFEFKGRRISHERRHALKATAGPGARIRIAHAPLIARGGSDRP
jgi:hypothetical protein